MPKQISSSSNVQRETGGMREKKKDGAIVGKSLVP
jgi:hypothetical protein